MCNSKFLLFTGKLCEWYTYGLLTKREVKMAGYWPSSFFACLWTETKDLLYDFFRALKKKPVACTINRRTLNHFIGLKV